MKDIHSGEAEMRLLPIALQLLLAIMLVGCDSGRIEELQAENDALSGQVDELNSRVEELESALREANDNIQQAAFDISTAQSYAYGNCQDLKYAVEAMNEPDEVSEP